MERLPHEAIIDFGEITDESIPKPSSDDSSSNWLALAVGAGVGLGVTALVVAVGATIGAPVAAGAATVVKVASLVVL
jgi:hypothetical protein